MERVRLKNTILAVINEQLDDMSTSALDDIAFGFENGYSFEVTPKEDVRLEDYQSVALKITRALGEMKRLLPSQKKLAPPPLPKAEIADDLFAVHVPITLDVSKLSNKERQILCQNMDDMLMMSCHRITQRTKKTITCSAKIGVRISRMWDEWKAFATQKMQFIKTDINDFFESHVKTAVMIFSPRIVHRFYKNQMMDEQFYFIKVPP